MNQKKKLWKIAVLLSLSLGLTMPVWAADVKEIISTDNKSAIIGADVSATAWGLTSQDTYPAGTSFDITVQALAGTSTSGNVSASGYGIYNNDPVTLTTGGNTITVTATGGKISLNQEDYSVVATTACGIQNNGPLKIENNKTISTGANVITVKAIGGKIFSNQGVNSLVSTAAYGIHNSGIMDTKENTIRVIALGGAVEGDAGSTRTTAIGMYSDGFLTAVGSQIIYTEAVAGTRNGEQAEACAYALLAGVGVKITLDSQGEAVQLTGDIGAAGYGSIVVSLDNENSFWRPRCQDTYENAENGAFGYGGFTIRDGGVLDLAWHANQGGYSFKNSQLHVWGSSMHIGDGATFIVNADLANDVADTISANTTATGTQYVQVAYDPFYSTQESVEGHALVLDFAGANGKGIESTMEAPLRNVILMPTMEGGYLVKLTRTMEASEGGKTASDSYQQQANVLRTQWSTLDQRLGDVRNENPEDHNGAWARTYGGKLKSDGAYGRKVAMKYGGIQAGYDRMREMSSGKYLAGFLVDYIDADSDFQRGDGETKALAFGGYWTWVSPKGHYADVVVKATHLDTDYSFSYQSDEKAAADFTNWGYTMSLEYGYRHNLKNNCYLEPQAQFLVGHLQSKTYRTSNGVSFHQDGVNLALGRLGVLFGWADENKSSAYVRGSLVHDFSGSGALTGSYAGDRMKIDTAGNLGTSFEVSVGANVVLSRNSHLYAELTKSFGGDAKIDWQANVGWRMKW